MLENKKVMPWQLSSLLLAYLFHAQIHGASALSFKKIQDFDNIQEENIHKIGQLQSLLGKSFQDQFPLPEILEYSTSNFPFFQYQKGFIEMIDLDFLFQTRAERKERLTQTLKVLLVLNDLRSRKYLSEKVGGVFFINQKFDIYSHAEDLYFQAKKNHDLEEEKELMEMILFKKDELLCYFSS